MVTRKYILLTRDDESKVMYPLHHEVDNYIEYKCPECAHLEYYSVEFILSDNDILNECLGCGRQRGKFIEFEQME